MPSSIVTTSRPPSKSMDVSYELVDGALTVSVESVGFEIEYDRLDTTGRTAHIHLYVDRDPPGVGDLVPLGDETIVHSLTNILTTTLDPGNHRIWVVAADGPDNAMVPPDPVLLEVTVPG